MNANLMSKKIEMSKNEAKAAGKIGSHEFNELQAYLTAYPGFGIEIKAQAKRKNDSKGLDYKFMQNHIAKCDRENKAEIMEKFNTLIAADKKNKVEGSENLETASYLEVKKWFLATFPEIEKAREDNRKKIQEILNAA